MSKVTTISYSEDYKVFAVLVKDQSDEKVREVVMANALGFELGMNITLEREEADDDTYYLRPSFDGMEDEGAFIITTIEAT